MHCDIADPKTLCHNIIMNKNIQSLFPSYVYCGELPPAQARNLNRALIPEIDALENIDVEGCRWSRKHYPNGYSSYGSMTQLHHTSPNFGELERLLKKPVKEFIRQLEWDLLGRTIDMTTCWANKMYKSAHHTMHLHPHSVISGVYFVSSPKGSSIFKMEDPRMPALMAAPPRKAGARREHLNYIQFEPKPGRFLLFESWMKHEVPPHQGETPRLSVSFNFELI